MKMFDQIIYLKQIAIENKEVLLKSGVTILASGITQIDKINGWLKIGASGIAIIVGILTIIKLWKELFNKNHSKDNKI